jgi:hypothetical protein
VIIGFNNVGGSMTGKGMELIYIGNILKSDGFVAWKTKKFLRMNTN